MKADYERQTSDISAVLTRLNAERAELANGVDNEHPALVAFMKYQNIEALNREILVELVDYIKVYENGNISVKFKSDDGMMMDIWTERANDSVKYDSLATQEDFDKF